MVDGGNAAPTMEINVYSPLPRAQRALGVA
jgi:hypothetical protein